MARRRPPFARPPPPLRAPTLPTRHRSAPSSPCAPPPSRGSSGATAGTMPLRPGWTFAALATRSTALAGFHRDSMSSPDVACVKYSAPRCPPFVG
eukprot:1361464-Prymnesium_polylepis.1